MVGAVFNRDLTEIALTKRSHSDRRCYRCGFSSLRISRFAAKSRADTRLYMDPTSHGLEQIRVGYPAPQHGGVFVGQIGVIRGQIMVYRNADVR